MCPVETYNAETTKSVQASGALVFGKFFDIDRDKSGTLTKEELEQFSRDPSAAPDVRDAANHLSQYVDSLSRMAVNEIPDSFRSRNGQFNPMAKFMKDDMSDTAGISRKDLDVMQILGHAEIIDAKVNEYKEWEQAAGLGNAVGAGAMLIPTALSCAFPVIGGIGGPGGVAAGLLVPLAMAGLTAAVARHAYLQMYEPQHEEYRQEFDSRARMLSSAKHP